MLKEILPRLRRVLELILGPCLIIIGIYMEVNNDITAFSQSYVHTLVGLLCIVGGTILLTEGILSYLERKSEKS